MKSIRCTAQTVNGQCKNKVIKGDLCYVHLKQQHLRIKQSRIHGNGLFAIKAKKSEPNTVFKQGEPIVEYKGKRIDQKKADERTEKGKWHYLFQVTKNDYIDGYKTTSGAGRYANDPRGTGMKANARFSVNTKLKKAKLVATKNIPDDKEILVSYGAGYWKEKTPKKKRKTKNSNK